MIRALLLSLLVVGCSSAQSSRVDALYSPETTYTASAPEVFDVDIPDHPFGARTVSVAVRWPEEADEPRPVVVWSHGGSDGKTNPLRSGPLWGEALAEAGYVAVNVAHPRRPRSETRALCEAVGYTSRSDCQNGTRSVKVDRPHDLIAVMDWVEVLALDSVWADRLDPSRLIVGGHSAGSGGSAELAGALRTVGAMPEVSTEDPRPVAFLLLALQGPTMPGGASGFEPDAWDAIDRPVFGATGLGDETAGDVPENRVLVFESLGSAESRLLWIEDAAAAHTLYNLETAACEREGGTADHCADLVDIVRTSALAFLDAVVLGRPEAQAWLDDTDLEAATDGFAWWREVR